LKQIEKQTLTNVIQGMLISDVGLRHAVQEHYGGVGGEDNWAMDALDSGNESEFSDI
jgi:hypothetical protein